ncbi:hypothetical protein [Mucilaginibacter phyllosphaerae]
MRFKYFNYALTIGNRFNAFTALKHVSFISFKNSITQLLPNNDIKRINTIKTTHIYDKQVEDMLENTKILSYFLQNYPQPALNTATVYINSSDQKSVSTASAYGLHTMLVPLCKQHPRRNNKHHI